MQMQGFRGSNSWPGCVCVSESRMVRASKLTGTHLDLLCNGGDGSSHGLNWLFLSRREQTSWNPGTACLVRGLLV